MKSYSAVIVTYYPDDEHLKKMLVLLKKQVEYIFVVDNTPNSCVGSSSEDNVCFIHLGENLGIATAQNIGLRESIKLGCVRCAIFDQDSIIPDGLCPILGADMDMLINNKIKVACIGPRIFDVLEQKVERSSSEILLKNNCFSTRQIIASGSLVNLGCIDYIGFMEDGLFIDAVDHEWCWRANNMGYKICISGNVQMKHMIGLDRGVIFIWKYIICSPIRHYYQFRNTLLLLFRNYVPLKWKIRKIIELIFLPIIYFVKGPDRIQRLKYMFKGIFNGLLGYAGKIN